MAALETWNPLDFGKLSPDAEGLSECLTWGIEPLKVLAETIYELDQATNQVSEKKIKNRSVYLCRFMMDRLYQVESFLWTCVKSCQKTKKRRLRQQSTTAKGKKAVLTISHPLSRYGLPVLLINGKPCRPDSILPSGITAKFLVRRFLENQDPGSGIWGKRTHEAVEMAKVYTLTADLY